MHARPAFLTILSALAWATIPSLCDASDGALDPSFAGTGETSLVVASGVTPSGNAMGVAAVAGKIVIAGTGSVPAVSSTLAIARLLDDGTPDASFGNLIGQPGRSAFDLSGVGLTFFYYAGFAASTAGTAYYLGGTSYLTPTYVGAVLRVDDTGNLDSAFAQNGYAIVDLSGGGPPHSVFARAVAATPQGGVLVAGDDYTATTPPSPYVVRFLADGTQDSSFNANTGFVYIPVPATAQGLGIVDIKLAAAGDIYLGIKFSPSAGGSRMALAHIDASGVLDTAFANASTLAIVDFGIGSASSYDFPTRIAVQPGGKILVTGSVAATAAPNERCGIARFNPNGAPDTAFGVAGRQDYAEVGGCDDIAVQGNRRILVTGNQAGDHGAAFVLALNIADGSIDNSFGTAGISEFSASTPIINALAIDRSQRPVLAGNMSTPGFYVARLTADVIYADGFDGD
ncbi:MAG: hypothetical protein ABIW82_14695 [Dokdonella sp.]